MPDTAAAIGTGVLEILAEKPHLGAVIVIRRGEQFNLFGVEQDGLERFYLNDAEDAE